MRAKNLPQLFFSDVQLQVTDKQISTSHGIVFGSNVREVIWEAFLLIVTPGFVKPSASFSATPSTTVVTSSAPITRVAASASVASRLVFATWVILVSAAASGMVMRLVRIAIVVSISTVSIVMLDNPRWRTASVSRVRRRRCTPLSARRRLF